VNKEAVYRTMIHSHDESWCLPPRELLRTHQVLEANPGSIWSRRDDLQLGNRRTTPATTTLPCACSAQFLRARARPADRFARSRRNCTTP
jgi:hypothetical protein